MKIYKESKVLQEVRRIKEKMSKEAARIGPERFYLSLNGTAARLMAKYRSPHRSASPLSSEARKAKRRALVDALPEPKAIQEVHRIRQEIRAEEKRVGSDQYWAEVNRRGKEFARRHGLKYVESPSSASVLHDKPAKKHQVH